MLVPSGNKFQMFGTTYFMHGRNFKIMFASRLATKSRPNFGWTFGLVVVS